MASVYKNLYIAKLYDIMLINTYHRKFKMKPTDCNWTRIHNHLVHKQTFKHLAKLA